MKSLTLLIVVATLVVPTLPAIAGDSTRSYTAVSNIMKSKHDTVKNSISNVR